MSRENEDGMREFQDIPAGQEQVQCEPYGCHKDMAGDSGLSTLQHMRETGKRFNHAEVVDGSDEFGSADMIQVKAYESLNGSMNARMPCPPDSTNKHCLVTKPFQWSVLKGRKRNTNTTFEAKLACHKDSKQKHPVLFPFYTRAGGMIIRELRKRGLIDWCLGSVGSENPWDIQEFVKWLHANNRKKAEELGIAWNQIVFIGYSAGGIRASKALINLGGDKVKGMIWLNSMAWDINKSVKPLSNDLIINGLEQKNWILGNNAQLFKDLKEMGGNVEKLDLPGVAKK